MEGGIASATGSNPIRENGTRGYAICSDDLESFGTSYEISKLPIVFMSIRKLSLFPHLVLFFAFLRNFITQVFELEGSRTSGPSVLVSAYMYMKKAKYMLRPHQFRVNQSPKCLSMVAFMS